MEPVEELQAKIQAQVEAAVSAAFKQSIGHLTITPEAKAALIANLEMIYNDLSKDRPVKLDCKVNADGSVTWTYWLHPDGTLVREGDGLQMPPSFTISTGDA